MWPRVDILVSMLRVGIVLCLSQIILCVHVFASPRDQAAPIYSWSACLKMVAQQNADLRAAIATYEATHDLEGVARNGFLPQISGSLNYQKADSTSYASGGYWAATVNGSQNLFSGFSDTGKYKQARANTRAAAATMQMTKARITNDLITAYEGLDYANHYKTLTAQIIERRRANLQLVTMRFEGGTENKGSVALSDANLASSKYDDLVAQGLRKVARAQLARVLGLDQFEEFEIEGEVPTTKPVYPPSLHELALATPDYALARAQQESADDQVTIARAAFLPALSLSGSAGPNGTDFFPHNNQTWSVGLTLSLPIFNGGRDDYSTRSALDSVAAADASRMNVSRQVLANLESVFANFNESVVALEVATTFRSAAMLRSEIARKRYNNGLMTFEDWDIIETDLIAREKTYVQSQQARVLGEAAWQQALGRGVL